MNQDRLEQLTEAIYDAVIEPRNWATVMALLRRSFSTAAESLYCLDYDQRRMLPIEVAGIPERFQRSFESCFYTEDNPSTHATDLHRPGVVRTDQRLGEHFRDAGILRRSRYYNEWLRPQNLSHTLGMTPWVEDGVIFNVTLLRSADAGPFRADETRRFGKLHSHLRRALRMAVRLEALGAPRGITAEALDYLPHGVIFINARGKVVDCNAAAEDMLQAGEGLSLRASRLVASDPSTHARLSALLQRTFAQAIDDAPQSIAVKRPDGAGHLVVSAIRLSSPGSHISAPQPRIMVLIARPDTQRLAPADQLACLYDLTPAEVRLAQSLLVGGSLRQAAARAGMTYETARWYLKILFDKTDTRRQADLIARLLTDLARAVPPR